MSGFSWARAVRSLDAHPKLHEDVRVRTVSGAVVSVVAALLMVVLFFSELSLYLSPDRTERLLVDTSVHSRLQINMDITFPEIPCAVLSLDVMDLAGDSSPLARRVEKLRLNSDGKVIGPEMNVGETHGGTTLSEAEVLEEARKAKEAARARGGDACSCYGAEEKADDCCSSCEEVREAYRKRGWNLETTKFAQCENAEKAALEEVEHREGCWVKGYLRVGRVQGNFHFAPGNKFERGNGHVHDLSAFQSGSFNVTHHINSLSFGEVYPGQVNPLDGTIKKVTEGGRVFKYFIKVVPTTFTSNGRVVDTNQFSVTEYETTLKERQGLVLPGVFVFYDIAPLMVDVTESRKSFLHFITQLCAIVGGVFTVSGIVDKILYTSLRQLEKGQMGKLG